MCLDFPSAENFGQNSSHGTFFDCRRNWCKFQINFILFERQNYYLSAKTESPLCHRTCTQIVPTCLSSAVLSSPELFFWAISTVCQKIMNIFTWHFNFLLGKKRKMRKRSIWRNLNSLTELLARRRWTCYDCSNIQQPQKSKQSSDISHEISSWHASYVKYFNFSVDLYEGKGEDLSTFRKWCHPSTNRTT